jgi:hypothetical protein
LKSWTAWNADYYADATGIAGGLDDTKVYFIYGLDGNSGGQRMPFNRVDYYLQRVAGEFPSSCAPNTYTLYRSVIKQSDGSKAGEPLFDCVKDFQVAFGLDKAVPEGKIDSWADNLAGLSAQNIRDRLREVRVFIVYQEGGGGGNVASGSTFRFSGTLNLGDQDIAHSLDSANYPAVPNTFQTLSSAPLSGSLKTFTPAGDEAKYRWKVIELAVKPMNLR